MYTSFNNPVNQELLNRGVNPYAGCLTMHEAKRLIDLMSKSDLTADEQSQVAKLQRKVTG